MNSNCSLSKKSWHMTEWGWSSYHSVLQWFIADTISTETGTTGSGTVGKKNELEYLTEFYLFQAWTWQLTMLQIYVTLWGRRFVCEKKVIVIPWGGMGGTVQPPSQWACWEGCISPPPLQSPPRAESDFGPLCQAESRGVIKNLILVGTIIMLVALVRHAFRYLNSSSVTAGT